MKKIKIKTKTIHIIVQEKKCICIELIKYV